MENTAENEVTTVTEEVADPQAETSPSDSKKAETKGVSERINKIRADYDAQLKAKDDELAEFKMLQDTLLKNGFTGKTAKDLAYDVMASAEGISIDDVRNREENRARSELEVREQIRKELLENDPELVQMQEEARQAIFSNQSRQDLAAIRAVYPDVKADTVLDLGDRFMNLMATGMFDPVSAYEVVLSEQAKEKNKIPPSTGSFSTGGTTPKEYYTKEEADRLTKADYMRDPSLFEKVRNSMLKWSK
jgi:hypothetical protein